MKSWMIAGTIGLVLGAVGAERGSAIVANWTGAADNYWTNSANWADSVVPGLCSNQVDSAWEVSGSRLDTAVFDGANFANASQAVTIDLSGLTSVKYVKVKGSTTPQITFGTSDAQKLYITAGGSNVAESRRFAEAGRFDVTADAGNVPVLEAMFGFAGLHMAGQDGSVICNSNTTQRLVIKKLAPRLPGVGSKGGTLRMYVTGSGDVEFAGPNNPIDGETRFQNDMTGGKIYFTGADFHFRVMGVKPSFACSLPHEMVLAEGTTLREEAGGSNGIECNSSRTIFSGAGTLSLNSKGGLYGEGSWFSVGSSTYSAEITCQIVNKNQTKKGTLLFVGSTTANPRPVITFHPVNNRANGYIKAHSGIVLDIDKAERLGADSLGVILSDTGRLRYSGTGEEIDKAIVITNNIGYIVQNGTGELVCSGAITCAPTATELVLAGDVVSPATLASAFGDTAAGTAMKLTKAGSGTWKVTGTLSHTGQTQIQGGELQFAGLAVPPGNVTIYPSTKRLAFLGGEDAPAAVTISELVLNAYSHCELSIAEGNTQSITIDSVTRNTGAALNIVAPANANITFSGMTESTDATWINWNGTSCSFDANGKLRQGYFSQVDVTIPVKGGIITNGAARVGIVNGGTGGSITLSAADTTVTSLAQKAAEAATVDLNGGTLKVGALETDSFAGSLTIGASAGNGTLKPSGSTLSVTTASTNGALEVKSAVDLTDASTINKSGDGTLRFADSVTGGGTFNINLGTLSMTNLPPFTLYGTGTFVKEGDCTWEPTAGHSGFNGDYAISNGVVRPRNGMTVFGNRTGKLTVGDGATLAMNLEAINNGGSGVGNANNVYFGNRDVHFQGSGVDGKGALQVEKSSLNSDMPYLFGNVTLDGDTYFNYPEESGQRFSIHFSNGNTATLDMNGHTLTKGGVGKMSMFSVYVTNCGPIVLESTMPTNRWDWRNEFLLYYDNDLGANSYVEMQSNSVLTLNYSSVPQRREIHVKGPATLRNIGAQLIGWDSVYNIWRGNAIFDESTPGNELTLNANYDNPYTRLVMQGAISGPGNVTVGPQGGRVDLCHTNTFTGSLTVDGHNNAFLVAMWPESIPSSCSVTVNYERISAPFTDGNGKTAWTADQFYALANSATLTNGAVIAAFARSGENLSMALSDEKITRTKSEDFGIGKDGPGTLDLTGANTKPIRMAAFDGTLNVTGDDTSIVVTNLLVTSDRGWNEGKLEVSNGGEIKIAPGGDILFGAYKTDTIKNTHSRARIAGKITQLDTQTGNGCINNSHYGLTIGGQSVACTNIVEIVDGADIAARMSICAVPNETGRKATVGAETQPVSAVYQTGGRVLNLGHASDGGTHCPYLGGAGAAYYKLSGGEYFSRGYFRWGCYTIFQANSDSLVFEQDGGKFISEIGSINIGNDSGAFLIYQSGGEAYCTNWFYFGFGTHANGALVLSGANTYRYFKTVLVGNQYSDRIGVVVRNGAVLDAESMKLTTGDFRDRRYTFSFDGGIWQSARTSGLFKNSSGEVPDSVTVYGGGATFKTLANNTMTVDAPLVAPQGQGVTEIALPEKFRKVAAPPAIAFTGESATMGGAVARCVYDKELGEVTGIEMLATGHGYTTAPTVTVRLGADAVTATATLGPVAEGGGVTVQGESTGKVVFACTNTYAGVTTVKSGTLQCACDYAVPSNGAVRVEGGTLDLNGKKAEFASFVCAGGTLAGASQLTLPNAWTIDVAAAYAGEVFTVPEGMSVPTTVNLANYSGLSGQTRSFTILSAPGSTVTSAPACTAGDLPPAWQLYWVGSELKLGVPRGISINFR